MANRILTPEQLQKMADVRERLIGLRTDERNKMAVYLGLAPNYISQLKTGSKGTSWVLTMLFALYFELQDAKVCVTCPSPCNDGQIKGFTNPEELISCPYCKGRGKVTADEAVEIKRVLAV